MKLNIAIFIGFCCVFTWCRAESLPVSHTAYSAIKQIESAEGAITQLIFHSFGKERIEMQMDNMPMVMINRPDKHLAWHVIPMLKMYLEMDLTTANQLSGELPEEVTIELVGRELVDNINTAKYKLLMKDKSAGGFIWLTADNIPIKMDFINKEAGEKQRITMSLSHLTLAPQDPTLFELPQGYQRVSGAGRMMADNAMVSQP
jgi:hypothetical protein